MSKLRTFFTSRFFLALLTGMPIGYLFIQFFEEGRPWAVVYIASMFAGAGILLIVDSIVWPILWIWSLKVKQYATLLSDWLKSKSR
jgi:hypothetical protein